VEGSVALEARWGYCTPFFVEGQAHAMMDLPISMRDRATQTGPFGPVCVSTALGESVASEYVGKAKACYLDPHYCQLHNKQPGHFSPEDVANRWAQARVNRDFI